MTEKSKNFSRENEQIAGPFFDQLKTACVGWFYMSETDAELEPFYGEKIDAVTRKTMFEMAANTETTAIEEGDIDSFFAHLWFNDNGVASRTPSGPIRNLRNLLEKNLSGLKVFRIGRIRIDVYVVGRDREGNLAGIKTRAVET